MQHVRGVGCRISVRGEQTFFHCVKISGDGVELVTLIPNCPHAPSMEPARSERWGWWRQVVVS